jgi:hypothetical protein
VAIKISIQGVHKKLKLPLADLVPTVLPTQVRSFPSVSGSRLIPPCPPFLPRV